MSSNEMNPWVGLLPAPKKINAFAIPEKSSVLEGNRRDFPSKLARRPNNMNPISLPGSSKFLAPEWQEKRRA